MANILPPDRLKLLRKTQRSRLIFAFGLVASIAAIITFITLLPSYLAVQLGPHVAGVEKNIKNATSTLAISEAQNLTTVLRPLMSTTTTTTAVEAMRSALALRPPGIVIDHVQYNRSVGVGTIVLGGEAASATDIDTYRTRLSADAHFTQVNVPVSALAGASNGQFAITLSGRF